MFAVRVVALFVFFGFACFRGSCVYLCRGRCPHRPEMVFDCQNGTMRASSPAMKIFFVNPLAKINEMCYNNSATHFNSIRYTLETNNMISLKVGKNACLAWTGYIIVLPESIS